MSLTREEFNEQCIEFVSRCRDLSDDWFVATGTSEELSKLNLNERIHQVSVETNLMLIKKEIRTSDCGDLRTFEYNIIYSDSYKVPVMLFNISGQDGSLVGIEEVVNLVSKPESEYLNDVINQVEHPILFRPFFMVHPCRTKDFMRDHKKIGRKNYLMCWLSTVGTLIGLKLDIKLANFLK